MSRYTNAKNCPFCEHHINANKNGEYYCPQCDSFFVIVPSDDGIGESEHEMCGAYAPRLLKFIDIEDCDRPMAVWGFCKLDLYDGYKWNYKCFECGRIVYHPYYKKPNYCPYCGAEM